MDRNQREQYKQKYVEDELRVDSYFLFKMGLLSKHTFLKVKDLILYAVPTKLSLSGGQLLISLGEREAGLFDNLESKSLQLKLRFNGSYFGKETGMFVKIQIKDVQHPGEGSSICLLGVTFQNPPSDFEDLILEMMALRDNLADAWNALPADTPRLPNTYFQAQGLATVTNLRAANNGKYRCLFVSLGPRSAEVYIAKDLLEVLSDDSESLKIEVQGSFGLILVSVTERSDPQPSHQERVVSQVITLDFHPGLQELLSPVISILQQEGNT